ncbi:hypothetical protein LAT59_01195 [Candidatus Gracilibacteria bacterium]|nr:hypothetical protein [Candidatus Gracilibacteria bacterium]
MQTHEIAIYGGAFNPPTLAHAQVVEEVLKKQVASHIILSPSGAREDKNFGIPQTERRRLIEIFFEVLQRDGLNVSLDTYFFEGKNTGITTTAGEEKYFREQLGVSAAFIFGSDVAPNMSWWSNNPDRFIEERLKKIFIQRPGFAFDFEANGFREYTLLDIPDMLDISSSLAREMLRNKQSVEGILFPELAEEIQKQKLYQ